MTPTKSHTNIPGHIGNGCLTHFPFPETFVRLIPQELVVEQSLICFSFSKINTSPEPIFSKLPCTPTGIFPTKKITFPSQAYQQPY